MSLPLLVMQSGQSGIVEAEIACGAENCSAFDITIEFDPLVIQVDELEVGPFLGEPVFTPENTIDNEAGIIRLAATALGDPPLTDETVLLRLTVTALGPGTSKLRITQLDIGDMIGNPLEAVGVDGGIAVTDAAVQTNTVQPTLEATAEATVEVTAEATADSAQATCEYTITFGDTLSGIAAANRVSVAEITEMNGITDPRRIVVGQVLTLPASNCLTALTAGQNTDVYDCQHLGSNVFEWYSVHINYDSAGNPTSVTNRQGPFQGAWRPGCPAGEAPQQSSGGGGGSRRGNGSSPNS